MVEGLGLAASGLGDNDFGCRGWRIQVLGFRL